MKYDKMSWTIETSIEGGNAACPQCLVGVGSSLEDVLRHLRENVVKANFRVFNVRFNGWVEVNV